MYAPIIDDSQGFIKSADVAEKLDIGNTHIVCQFYSACQTHSLCERNAERFPQPIMRSLLYIDRVKLNRSVRVFKCRQVKMYLC